jgi:hypothetical protein
MRIINAVCTCVCVYVCIMYAVYVGGYVLFFSTEVPREKICSYDT